MSGPRVGVNLLWMIPEVVGGSEQYTVRLLEAVAASHDYQLVLFVRPDFAAHHPDLAAATETVVAPRSGVSRAGRVVLENTWLPLVAMRKRVELMHHPGGTLPWCATSRTVLGVHDLQPLELPENFSPLKRRYLSRALPRSVSEATKVTATSEYVARDLAERFGIPVDQVAVVSAGPGSVSPSPSAEVVTSVRARYGLGERYVIYPAITYAHKNHWVLLRAAGLLDGVQVALPGGTGPEERALCRFIDQNHLNGVVKRLGRIAGAEFDALLWGATALTFPSVYEGFGLPVVEAMARGVPVIVADSTCLPELVGTAGIIVDPHDVEGWAAAIDRVATDRDFARALAAHGVERAAEFTSEAAGGRLAAAYDEVLSA